MLFIAVDSIDHLEAAEVVRINSSIRINLEILPQSPRQIGI
jgi:hypothetical protein